MAIKHMKLHCVVAVIIIIFIIMISLIILQLLSVCWHCCWPVAEGF